MRLPLYGRLARLAILSAAACTACGESSATPALDCPAPTIPCSGECIDPAFDIRHCGACDNACSSCGCFGGACTSPQSMGRKRGAHAGVVGSDGRIYVFGGGTDNNSKAQAIVEAYDPRTNHWSDLPGSDNWTARSYATAALLADGKILVAGGAESNDDAAQTTVDLFDPTTVTWRVGAPLTHPRRDHAMFVGSDGLLRVVAGLGEPAAALSTAEVLADDGWKEDTVPSPVATFGLRAATGSDGRTYLTGGVDSANDLFVLDLAEWMPLASMTEARSLHGFVGTSDGRLLAIGGFVPNDSSQSVEAYDLATREWAPQPDMPDKRFDAPVVAGPGGRIYVIGGAGPAPGTGLDDLFVFDVAANTWCP